MAIARALAELVARRRDPRSHPEFQPPADAPLAAGDEALPQRRSVFLRQIAAEVAALLGEHDAAVLAVQSSVEAGLIDRLWLERCPLLDALRDNPRFAEASLRVGARCDRVLDALEPG